MILTTVRLEQLSAATYAAGALATSIEISTMAGEILDRRAGKVVRPPRPIADMGCKCSLCKEARRG